jgi:ethanolamine utilization protein EutQ
MPSLITTPTCITAVGNKPKVIAEFIGRANTGETRISIAHMLSPGGWVEPGQTPEFDEFSVVLAGTLRVTCKEGVLDVSAGQTLHARPGEWVQYSTPTSDGAEYLAVCLPAFSPQAVHRDGERPHPDVAGGWFPVGSAPKPVSP